MIKLSLSIIFLIFLYSGIFSQSCLPEGISFSNQSQIDNFQVNYPNCTEIEGSVEIKGTVTNLDGLNMLTTIGGGLKVNYTTNLITLEGLDNLSSIGGYLQIYSNDALIKIIGLNQVSAIDAGLSVTYNTVLNDISGFEKLLSVSYDFLIMDNPGLLNISGFDSLATIGGSFYLSYNSLLEGFTGLGKLHTIGHSLFISNNDAFEDLTGFNDLSAIGRDLFIYKNNSLTSLTGLENIDPSTISVLEIYQNTSLSSCDAQSICNFLSDPKGTVKIYGNAPGCNNPVEVANACGFTIPCLPYGDYYFFSQNDIDSFQENYPDCGDLKGNVTIFGSDIVSLSGLNSIISVDSNLNIKLNSSLSSLSGLNNLTTVGDYFTILDNQSLLDLSGLNGLMNVGNQLLISGNDNLLNLHGLENLTNIDGSLYIGTCIFTCGNKSLQSLSGLENLQSIGGTLSIFLNDSLTSLGALNNLTSVEGSVSISQNASLTNLQGLNNLGIIGQALSISGMTSLTDLSGLEGLAEIGKDLTIGYNSEPSNSSLTSIHALSNLTSIGQDLNIINNDILESLDGLENIAAGSVMDLNISKNNILSDCSAQSICQYLSSPGGSIVIQNNAIGCNTPGEVAEACSITMPCPESIVFQSQNDIDYFQEVYPDCSEIANDVVIEGNNIKNLFGLSQLISIGGDLDIENNDSLNDLVGLDNLVSIGGFLNIANNSSLFDITSLLNITSVGESFSVRNNDALTSLSGLDNIDTAPFHYIYVSNNESLTYCQIQNVCNLIASGIDSILFYNNAPGCNDVNEVEEACDSSFCLPEGIVFSTQSDIDLFIANYPSCSVIKGNLTINGHEIQDLSFLNNIISIGGNLVIAGNDILATLSGLENIISIAGDLIIGREDKGGNPSLIDITALGHLSFLGGNLEIRQNISLSSLAGIENIQTANLNGVIIIDNPELSVCDLDNICEYIHSPQGNSEIRNNAQGCNSTSEVMELCENWIPGWNSNRQFIVFPNPAKNTIKISENYGRSKIKEIAIYNSIGQKAIHTTDRSDELNVSKLNRGFYVIEIVTEDYRGRLKLVIEK